MIAYQVRFQVLFPHGFRKGNVPGTSRAGELFTDAVVSALESAGLSTGVVPDEWERNPRCGEVGSRAALDDGRRGAGSHHMTVEVVDPDADCPWRSLREGCHLYRFARKLEAVWPDEVSEPPPNFSAGGKFHIPTGVFPDPSPRPPGRAGFYTKTTYEGFVMWGRNENDFYNKTYRLLGSDEYRKKSNGGAA